MGTIIRLESMTIDVLIQATIKGKQKTVLKMYGQDMLTVVRDFYVGAY